MLLTYIGGMRDTAEKYGTAIGDLTEEQIFDIVDADIRKILLKPGAPGPVKLGLRKWKRAIPQYERGHNEIIGAMMDDMAKCPGLYLMGNYRTGVAFGDCVASGIQTAYDVAEYVGAEADKHSAYDDAALATDLQVLQSAAREYAGLPL